MTVRLSWRIVEWRGVLVMACCVFAAYLFGLLWRAVRAAMWAVGALFGRRPPQVDVVAPGAVRTVVIPRELNTRGVIR